ncbi:MAG: hypothetical protein Kow0074_25140 [Candidatus Zixiibacteriota bacterium]
MTKRFTMLTACLVLFVAVFVFTATAAQYEEAYANQPCNCTYTCCGGSGIAGGILIPGQGCQPCDENRWCCCTCECW